MEQQVLSLIKLIHKEVDSLENFLKLLTEEEECLVNNSFDSLEESILKQEQALTQAKQLEKERIEITSWLFKGFKVDQKKASLTKLVQLLDSSYSSKLEELQKTLLYLHRKVEVQREKNGELIKDSMGYIDRSIKFLMEPSPVSYLKDPSHNRGKARPPLVLDKVG
ncbi:MAG: flagellar protein FlgN [candidate division Zixibacteria bacterium]|nr:flagellar protein FlgN [candidate division Zixibacteria bacterium]